MSYLFGDMVFMISIGIGDVKEWPGCVFLLCISTGHTPCTTLIFPIFELVRVLYL